MPRRQPITEKQLPGFKYFKKLPPLFDLPAEVIALIYKKRWTVELFFAFTRMIRFYLTGWADEDELAAHIAKLQAAKS